VVHRGSILQIHIIAMVAPSDGYVSKQPVESTRMISCGCVA